MFLVGACYSVGAWVQGGEMRLSGLMLSCLVTAVSYAGPVAPKKTVARQIVAPPAPLTAPKAQGRRPANQVPVPVVVKETPEKPNLFLRKPAPKVFRLGPQIRYDLGYASVGYSSTGETTSNLSGGLQASWFPHRVLGLMLTVTYNRLTAGRTLSYSNIIEDSRYEIKQVYQYLGASLVATFNFQGDDLRYGSEKKLRWDLNAGFDYWHPLSASQVNALGTTVSFQADKLLFALLGLSWEYPLTESMAFGGTLHGLYNVATLFTSNSANRLLGGRLGVALLFSL